MANVNLKYQDGQNWTNVNGKIINWTNLSEHYKDERVQPQFVPYTVVTDIWGGVSHKVQEIAHDAWRLEFYIKESEVHDINRMLSCATVLITDIDNNLNHVADTSPGQLELTEPERINTTSNFKVVLVYKTNKSVINKFDALDNQVTIVGSGTYYSKYAKIAFKSPLEEVKVPWNDGLALIESTLRTGFQVLFYLSDSELETFKDDYYSNSLTIDTVAVEEVQELDINPLGEDNYKVVATFITDITTTNQTTALDTVITLTRGANTYLSKYVSLTFSEVKEELTVFWDLDEDRVLARKSEDAIKVLLLLSESEFTTFIQDYNRYLISIDGTPAKRHLEYEETRLESGNHQIIGNFVTGFGYTDETTALSNRVDLLTGAIHFYSKFFKLPLSIPSEKIEVDWFDGTKRLLRETHDIGFRTYLYDSDLTTFQDLWYSDTFTIDGAVIKQKLDLEVELLQSQFYQIIVPCITSVNVDTKDLTPLNTHELVITDTGGPYTFHTDYSTVQNTDDTEKEAFDNEDALLVDAKIISRQVTDIKLFLNTSDKNSLKLHYEKSTAATIDTVPILYRGIVESEELDTDIWEVNIKGLTTTPTITYPL